MSTIISEIFSVDHNRLDLLFASYQRIKNSDHELATRFFHKFRVGLEQHIKWEEELLFPKFEEATGMFNAGPTMVMRNEHAQIKGVLGEIAASLSNKQDSSQLEHSLLEILFSHNEKEEHILYVQCDRLIDSDSVATMLLEM